MSKELLYKKTFCAGCREPYLKCYCGEGEWVLNINFVIELLIKEGESKDKLRGKDEIN